MLTVMLLVPMMMIMMMWIMWLDEDMVWPTVKEALGQATHMFLVCRASGSHIFYLHSSGTVVLVVEAAGSNYRVTKRSVQRPMHRHVLIGCYGSCKLPGSAFETLRPRSSSFNTVRLLSRVKNSY